MKDYKISLIRLIAMLLIISCHIFQGLNMEIAFWLNVGVQIFFFLSGFLYGKKDTNINVLEWYKKRLIKKLLPLAVLNIIILFIDVFFFNVKHDFLSILANLLGFGGFYGAFSITSHTWFVSYILLCYLITPLLAKINFKKMSSKKFYWHLLCIFLFLLAIYIFKVTNITIAWIFNYILGYYFAAFYVAQNKKYSSFNIVVFILTILFLIPRMIIQYYPSYWPYPSLLQYESLITTISHVFIGSSLFLLMYMIFYKIKIKENVILKFSDKYSYYIYLVHQIFILNTFSLLWITSSLFINVIIILSVTIISALVLFNITKLVIFGFNRIKSKYILVKQ